MDCSCLPSTHFGSVGAFKRPRCELPMVVVPTLTHVPTTAILLPTTNHLYAPVVVHLGYGTFEHHGLLRLQGIQQHQRCCMPMVAPKRGCCAGTASCLYQIMYVAAVVCHPDKRTESKDASAGRGPMYGVATLIGTHAVHQVYTSPRIS
jgi:hypothetical protein